MPSLSLRLLPILLATTLMFGACDDKDASTETDAQNNGDAADTFVRPPGSIRLALEVTNDVPESIWVQLNDSEGQVAWVTVKNAAGDAVWFHERCSIEACENPSGVCGLAEIQVRDITGSTYTGQIELYWSGQTSVFEGSPECERREAAPAGAYTASFCWSLTANLENTTGDPTKGVAGTLANPVCQDVDFEFPKDEDVVFKIQGG